MRQATLLVLLCLGCRSEETNPEEEPEGSDPEPEPSGDDDDDDDDGPVDADGDSWDVEQDCDDSDASVYPGAPELCGDGRLTDCDRTSEEGLVTVNGSETFESLHDALGAATSGSTVTICGDWAGVFDAAVPLTLVGEAGAVLDAGGSGTVLTVAPGSSVVGLTLQNGRTEGSGGGLRLSEGGELTIESCLIQQNVAEVGGGGLFVPEGSTVIARDTLIVDNRALGGGGIELRPGSLLDLTSSTVQANLAAVGGGVLLADAEIIGGLIEQNEATEGQTQFPLSGGGGLGVLGTVTVTGTELADNQGIYGAGFSSTLGVLTLVDVLVHGNHNPPNVGGYGGGGQVYQGELVMLGATALYANQANYAGGLEINYAIVTGGVVDDNTADQDGGGIELHGDSVAIDMIVTNNDARGGGGVNIASSSGDVVGGLVSGNSASNGGGLLCGYSASDCTVDGTEISDNEAQADGGGVHARGRTLTLSGVSLWRNTADRGGGAYITEGTLSSVASDWGTDADDNVPDDVRSDFSFSGYGADATFTCESECSPLP